MPKKQDGQPTGHFDAIIKMTDDEVRAQQVVIARRQLQRSLESAYDSAFLKSTEVSQLIDRQYDAIRKNPTKGVETYDVSWMIARRAELAQYTDAMEAIEEEYAYLFGEPLSK